MTFRSLNGIAVIALMAGSVFGQDEGGGVGDPDAPRIPGSSADSGPTILNVTDPLATSFVAAPGGSFQNRTDPLATIGTPVVVGGSPAGLMSGLAVQSTGGSGGGPVFLNPTQNLATNSLEPQAASARQLIQIKVRVVEVDRSDAFQAASALDYISSHGGRSSMVTGNNINNNQRNLSGGSRFPALVRSTTNPLLGLATSGTALGAPGSGMLVNLTAKHLNLVTSILATDLNADIVTAPQVTTLNGQNVEFVAGSQQPFQLGQSIVGPANSSVQNFFYKHIGSYISVTPTYTEDTDEIELAVVVRLSDSGSSAVQLPTAGGGFASANIPTESAVRAISNIVRVRNGYGLVMGGLIGESEIETVSRVPILGDIPWAGALFRSKETGRRKTETLIFIEAAVLSADNATAWGQTMADFHLGQDYVNSSNMFDTNLECGLFRAGIGNYLPPLRVGEECYWERLDRTIRRQATHLDDLSR